MTTQYIVVDIVNYLYSFQNIVLEPEKKGKKRQESEDERWARLDRRARARHEVARLVMGTIFLVLLLVIERVHPTLALYSNLPQKWLKKLCTA